MSDKNINQDVEHQEKLNLKLYSEINSLNVVIAIIHFFFFWMLFLFASNYLEQNIIWYKALIIFLSAFLLLFIASWLFSLPFRIWIYKISKITGLLNQDFQSWLVDWLKVLFLNLIFMVPVLSLMALIVYLNLNKSTFNLLASFFIVLLLFIPVKTIQRFLAMSIIHGFERLKDGTKYHYWKTLLKQNQLKEYPIFILQIEKKASWSNALAFGIKNLGIIYTSDKMVNDLTEEQFAAVMAHETAHLENNDILKRISFSLLVIGFFLGMPLLFYLVPIQFFLFFTLLYLLIVLLLSFLSLLMVKHQEIKADIFSSKLLKSGKPLAEALDYLYTVNKIPKENRKNIITKHLKLYPDLNERKYILENS